MQVLYFGGGTIGAGTFSTLDNTRALLDLLHDSGITHIDTAGVYPATAPGASEYLLGAANAAGRGFTIDTKINVTGEGPGQGSLKTEAIDRSLATSLSALHVTKVNTLYCHIPDIKTPIEETAATLHRHWTDGKFQRLGLSNYEPNQVKEFLSICDKHGWVKPSVYQGQYNAVCRNMENELLPLLRRHGMTYVAFSPLAGGFLTGNLSLGNDLSGTRFADGNPMGAHYKQMFDKATMHVAIEHLNAFLQPRGISMAGASLRWLFYHSALGEHDGVILGASKTAQIERNVAEIAKGPLEDSVVEAFEKTWEAVGEAAP